MTTTLAMGDTTEPAAARLRREQQLQQQQGRQLNSSGCGGDGCVARDPWPVHHVRHRGNLCRLCTSCVLRYHPGSFCPKCFDLVEPAGGRGPHPQPPAVVHCASCPSVCHSACLADSEKTSSYLCPSCANPNGCSYFPVDCDGDGGDVAPSGSPSKRVRVWGRGDGGENPPAGGPRRPTIDRHSAKALLAAARLASASMNRAVAFARSEAERKAKDAVVARKKAKEMLEKALMAAKREREKRQDVLLHASATAESQRKASVKLDDGMVSMVAQKRKQNREREWMKVVEDATPLSQKSPLRAITENERVKVPFTNSHLNHSSIVEDNVKLDLTGKNGSLPASKSNLSVENKRSSPKVPVESGVDVRLPQTKQDAPVTKSNPRVIFTGMPDKTSLHS
ncbi:hypothetical protein Taro_043444 [Colocasia esculenta]|uniref:Uncharacterized protein n=1 Tax=Colocasia esculenta TaxID=4460 RepID=A0A843WRF5_COLES|nr:hypothetical protein [Colocasia esculenta]